jgi:hypothetical protein
MIRFSSVDSLMAHTLKRFRAGLVLLAIGAAPAPEAWAQPPVLQQGTDISGSWIALNHEDGLERGPGPYAVDYTGLPLNEEGRARALTSSLLDSMIERQCAFWSAHYIVMGPWPLRIWGETNPVTGRTIAWKIGAWEDRGLTTIWLDGRPHPSPNARHTTGGFTTGVWEGNQLIATTTHFKSGMIRKNGAPSSDQETLTTHFIRHGDLLTVVAVMEDSLYLTEPYIVSTSFRLSVDGPPLAPIGPPCIPTYEGDPGNGSVPHILPGQNPSIDELTKLYGIPREAVLGGAETMYPEYRKKIKDKFVLPEKCTRNCSPPLPPPPQQAPPPAAPPPR